MIRKRVGLVKKIIAVRGRVSELEVETEGKTARAINYSNLTGAVEPGDRVILNNTALYLGLGTGGFDFVYHNSSRSLSAFKGPGHIIKLRYTPWQFKVLSCEEEAAGYQKELNRFKSLNRIPVLIGELHSVLAPATAVIKQYCPQCRLIYLMTDGGALPLGFSRSVDDLQEKKLLNGTITSGHAFGGDLEAVNVYSALIAGRMILKADLIIIAIGPGHVGTGTRFGFSGMEVGEHVNRVNALGGVPFVIPRISFADSRPRHYGISHHTITALTMASCTRAHLVLPLTRRRYLGYMLYQLKKEEITRRHCLHIKKPPPVEEIMSRFNLAAAETMGRRYAADPVFFQAVGAAAQAAAEAVLLQQKCETGEMA